MKKMHLKLLTMPLCYACKAMKATLDYLMIDNGYSYDFDYEVIDVSRNQSLVEEFSIQTVPILIFPTNIDVRYNPGRERLLKIIQEQQIEFDDME